MAASGERGDGVCGLTTLSGRHISALSNNHVVILWRLFLTTSFIPTCTFTKEEMRTEQLAVVLLSVTLFLRLRVVRYGCSLPAQKTVADEER